MKGKRCVRLLLYVAGVKRNGCQTGETLGFKGGKRMRFGYENALIVSLDTLDWLAER